MHTSIASTNTLMNPRMSIVKHAPTRSNHTTARDVSKESNFTKQEGMACVLLEGFKPDCEFKAPKELPHS